MENLKRITFFLFFLCVNIVCYAQKESLDSVIILTFSQYDKNPSEAEGGGQLLPQLNKAFVYKCIKLKGTANNRRQPKYGNYTDFSNFSFSKFIGKTTSVTFYTDTFYLKKHKMDYNNQTIDGKSISGFDGIENEDNAKISLDGSRYLSNGEFHFGTTIFNYNFNNDRFNFSPYINEVYQTVDEKYIIIDYSGGDGAGSYGGFWIFSLKNLVGEYSQIYGYGNYENVRVDAFSSSNKKYYYEIKVGNQLY